jgi:PII-like signaling protein
MKAVTEKGELLRIFLNETSRYEGKPLYHVIVQRALDAHLRGATVLKSPMGFGVHREIHTSHLVEVSRDLPIIIEIVDAADRIEAFMPVLEDMISEGLVTRERVEVIRYFQEEMNSDAVSK